ncbi:MAG: S8 family serine peptidase, partial [Planctomycetota bacterium]
DDGNGYVDDIVGYDVINDDRDPRDDSGHGTHCAGIIAALGDNVLSIAGVCWNARIMVLKILDENGDGEEADAATAICYAVDNGADVTSNSYGGPDYSQTMEEAVAYAHSQGVIMVAAAGNDNTDSPLYPAYHRQMVAVAATDSRDRKAGFSSYGDWVDIAAPGVDILSLRGWATSLGEVYDTFTTILSGTSMACPHVAGVAALIISRNPEAPTEYVTAKLLTAADDISDKNPDYEGLLGTGRVSAFKAVRDGAEGFITLDKNLYSCNDVVRVKVVDADLTGQPTQDISLTTDAGDEETVTLAKDVNMPWIFTATIYISTPPVEVEDGVLQVSHGQTITGTYYDSDHGSGTPATLEASAATDCEAPAVVSVEATDVYSSSAKIRFRTNEPTTGLLRCGLTCGAPYAMVRHDPTWETSHTFVLTELKSETTYYFEIEAVDSVGNQTTDDANGQCYTFTTPSTPPPIHVPGQYPTIQEAIDAATPGDIVVIADGIYTGEGNRDLSFRGKTITVRSQNGPENCVIDCQGTQTQQHRAFKGFAYHCVLQGLTVTNAYHDTGALYCSGRPKITDCIITGNRGLYAGGISCPSGSYPTISHCIISNNSSVHEGGGIRCGASDSHLNLSNCIISGNNAAQGAGIHWASWEGSLEMTNCVVFSNVAAVFAGGIWVHNKCTAAISNSVFWGNVAVAWGPAAAQIYVSTGADAPVAYVTYCDIQDGWTGQGNIDAHPRFVDAGGGDFHLREESPCINAGDPNYSGAPSEADIDGQPRVIGGRIDMGADEFHGDNTPPVADAGEDQTAYSRPYGAEVTLDGTGSNDGDGHLLTYLWSWTIDGNSLTATGPSPIIQLPPGEHLIRLVVNDRVVDSEPDEVHITVVPPVQVPMKFTPQALNPGSHGNWVKARFVLPEGFVPDDVNTNTPAEISEPFDPPLESQYLYGSRLRQHLTGLSSAPPASTAMKLK